MLTCRCECVYLNCQLCNVQAHPYYDLGIPDSDEELDPVASDVSGMTDVRAELNGTLDDADSIHKK